VARKEPPPTDHTIQRARAETACATCAASIEIDELALAEAVIYLACAAKSNAVYVAYNAARAFIAGDGSRPVPLRLRNAPTRLMKHLGYGKDYRYAHNEEDAYAAGEHYFPDGMEAARWYVPTDRGLEAKIGERLAALRDRDAGARPKDEDKS